MPGVDYPAAPVLEPMEGGLLTVAGVREVDNIGWLGTGENLYQSYGQMDFGFAPTFPCNPQATSGTKDLAQTSQWVSGFRFGAYGGTQCKLVGNADVSAIDAEVLKVFDIGETVAIETAFMATRLAVAAGENAPGGVKKWTDPVDITPAGGAVKPKVGIAMLEGWMARRYQGQPTIHLPTIITALVMGLDGVALEEKVLRTKLGSAVVNGAGYDEPNTGPDGSANSAGERWIYATGPVLIDRSRVVLHGALDQASNDYFRLAERAYIGSADGPTAAVRVQVTI